MDGSWLYRGCIAAALSKVFYLITTGVHNIEWHPIKPLQNIEQHCLPACIRASAAVVNLLPLMSRRGRLDENRTEYVIGVTNCWKNKWVFVPLFDDGKNFV